MELITCYFSRFSFQRTQSKSQMTKMRYDVFQASQFVFCKMWYVRISKVELQNAFCCFLWRKHLFPLTKSILIAKENKEHKTNDLTTKWNDVIQSAYIKRNDRMSHSGTNFSKKSLKWNEICRRGIGSIDPPWQDWNVNITSYSHMKT